MEEAYLEMAPTIIFKVGALTKVSTRASRPFIITSVAWSRKKCSTVHVLSRDR